MKALTNR